MMMTQNQEQKKSARRIWPRVLALGLAALLGTLSGAAAPAASAQTTLFDDEFDASTLDSSKWGVADDGWVLQRSRLGQQPLLQKSSGVSFARLRLNTYAPIKWDPAPNDGLSQYFYGTEIYTKQLFSLGAGVEFETRMRATSLPSGAIMAFFTYGDAGYFPTTARRDEIDNEILGNLPTSQIWSHVWSGWNPNYGYDDGIHDLTTIPNVAGYNRKNWNVYKIRWLNDRVEIYINNVLVKTESRILPQMPQSVHFNIWAADTYWQTAYNANLKTASSASKNKSYSFDVDYLRVRSIAPSAGAFLGNGTGLTASYFDNTDFTGTQIARIDERVNNDWNAYFTEPSLGPTYSARYTGQVQAQYTQPYTFTVKADDVVRLWINDRLLISNNGVSSSREYSATVNLTAGAKTNIRLEYANLSGGGDVKLYWSSPSTPKQLVPQSQLYYQSVTDTAPPTVNVAAPVSQYSYRSPLTASGNAIDSGSGVARVTALVYRAADNTYWSGSQWTGAVLENAAAFSVNGDTATWNYNLPSLSQGLYAFQSAAQDAAGNKTYSSWIYFYYDVTPPNIVINTPVFGGSYASGVFASGTAQDVGPGVAWVRGRLRRSSDGFYWNGAQWTPAFSELAANGTTNWNVPFPPLAPGAYSFQALASDYVGNINYTAPNNFTVR